MKGFSTADSKTSLYHFACRHNNETMRSLM